MTYLIWGGASNDQDVMCGVRLVDRVSTDILWDRVGVVVKTEAMIIQIKAVCCGIVMSFV